VVENIADDVDYLGGDVDAAVGHEMVDVIDDDEVGLLLLDEGLDGSVDVPEVVTLAAEDVEADEVEVLLVDGMGCELAVDGGADVGAVEGVNPEDLAAAAVGGGSEGIAAHADPIAIAGGGGSDGVATYIDPVAGGHAGLVVVDLVVIAGEDLDGEVLGEMVGTAGLLASEVGDMVLAQDGLAVDGDQWLDSEVAEIGVTCELAGFPRFLGTLAVGLTIIVDFHGVFLGFKIDNNYS
jgi:hypothetical protein